VDPAKAAAHGLSPRAIAQIVAGALSPMPLGNLGGSGPAVTLRLDPRAVTAQKIADLAVGPGTLLRDVATISNEAAPDSISRRDGIRLVTVSGTINGSDTTGPSTRASALVKSVSLPVGVKLDTGGTSEDINQSFQSMFEAIGIAIALVFIILVIFFRSVVNPVRHPGQHAAGPDWCHRRPFTHAPIPGPAGAAGRVDGLWDRGQ
jgi:HAE1 family hydrophobic/amphiphilic exporter-1